MADREAIEPSSWGKGLEWYKEQRLSPAVRVGDLLFVSGCTGSGAVADGPGAQMHRAYTQIAEVLAAAGGSWSDVVSMTTYHVGFHEHIDAMTDIHKEFVTEEPFPAWTAVGVTDLYDIEGIVEIAVIAVVRQEGDASITR
jgi:enamine deaminase RidA (YjgF/YER057c/UK114 family)